MGNWRTIILFLWPVLIMADYFMTTRLLAMGGIELNPIVRFVLQFGTPYFLMLSIVQVLVMIVFGITLNRILRKINLVFGWAPQANIILTIWTLELLMPVVWNGYWLYIWRL